MQPGGRISIIEARQILGNTAKGLSDDAIERLITQVDTLSEVIINHIDVSKKRTPLDLQPQEIHTD